MTTKMTDSSLALVILAAGKGTRMKSEKAKVLHQLFYQPMVAHVLHATAPLDASQTVVVVGHQKEAVESTLKSFNVDLAEQTEQNGTGHAVLAAEQAIKGEQQTIMILCGDTPLIRSSTLQSMYEAHLNTKSDLTLMTTVLDDPTNYGRIISDDTGNLLGIVEQKDASPKELEIQEINAGIYCVNSRLLFTALKNVGTDNKQGEVYLTDIVQIAVKDQLTVKKFTVSSPIEVLGVNSRLELSDAQQELQLRRNRELMSLGISMISPETIRVSPEAEIMPDVLLEPCVHIFGTTKIGNAAVIEQAAVLKNCTIGKGARIGAGSSLENIVVEDGQVIMPLTREP